MKNFFEKKNFLGKIFITFVIKIVQNLYIVQSSATFSSKTPKPCQFFLKNPLFFKIYGAFGAEKFCFRSQNPRFVVVGPPETMVPPNSSLVNFLNIVLSRTVTKLETLGKTKSEIDYIRKNTHHCKH